MSCAHYNMEYDVDGTSGTLLEVVIWRAVGEGGVVREWRVG